MKITMITSKSRNNNEVNKDNDKTNSDNCNKSIKIKKQIKKNRYKQQQ